MTGDNNKKPPGEFTHTTWAFRRISKKYGRYVEVGVARLPACPNCGAHPAASAKVFLDRLPLGGFSGGLLLEPHDSAPPELPPEFPDQPDFDEKEMLPDG
jgi:hypothetical protein